ncbi:uncharacterized protein LOC110714764 [Chenopodium quinoa]|uniref:uncharacterized protein LOC110714764 n=1 Tax=Chenopodium quinoa TaxID=63459 RepID=UPI000B77E2A7|nr:uncharacterized protein LOC110714764 [Chenopodium quinoa]XP_021749003.1 uncharacterized protein LOC110714764 [Chenopodium quinoa]XP_021749004.1 uncharacterized protein LOC110714764 [Chenopodium quinoa]XP_021749005.1 uncharacterized protein LOC110714764 [Chenopodium quinoa]
MMRATSKLLSTLWKSLSSSSQPATANTKLLMNTAWTGLEKTPQGSFKKKIYGVGLWLLSRVKPSKLFVTGVEITYPISLNDRLVRRRLRHIAMSGSVIHKKFPYGSASLLPVSSVFNRTYSHRRAWQINGFMNEWMH